MKVIKGLNLDYRPSDIPEGFSSFTKNGLLWNNRLINEKGFDSTNVKLPYEVVGKVDCDVVCVLFMTDNVNSEIGTFDYRDNSYKTVVNDSTLDYKFNFNTGSPLKGEWERNYKSELIVAFKDNINNPRIINIDNNKATDINDYLLFPNKTKCKITYNISNNGNLKKGSYTPVIRYINEGVYTDYFNYGKALSIGNSGNGSIHFTLTNLDKRYKEVELAIIQVNDGVTTVVSVNKRDITDVVKFVYTGTYKYELSLEEVLAVSAHYTIANAIGRYNDEIFLADLEEYNMDRINYYMQKSACDIQLRCKSKLVQDVVGDAEQLSVSDRIYSSTSFISNLNYLGGAYKTLMHQEVYCFYIRAILKNGITTQGYVIPNRALTTGDREVNANYINNPKYKVEDTCSIDTDYSGENIINYGVWENQNETYPNKIIGEYGNPFGSLAGQKVRHFKTPSHHYCNSQLYDSIPEANYGASSLDVLLPVIKTYILPPEIEDEIESVELCFAKRDVDNITNLGQSLYLCGAGKYGSTPFPTNVKDITSTGGNFHYSGYGIESIDDVLRFDETFLRFHGFDIMNTNPSAIPTVLVNQIKLQKDLMKVGGIFGREGVLNRAEGTGTDFDSYFKERSFYQIVDYTTGNAVTQDVPNITEKFRSISKFKRMINNGYTSDFDNRLLEECYVGRLGAKASKYLEINPVTNYPANIEGDTSVYKQTILGESGWIDLPRFEITYLCNIIKTPDDVYINFDNQELIGTGITFLSTNGTKVEGIGGDCFISDYSFVTYGKRGFKDTAYEALQGTRFIHRFLCETMGNPNLRYEKTGDMYSYSYPKQDGNWIKDVDKSLEPNRFGYDKEFNKLNDYEPILPFSLSFEPLYTHPYRIIRSSPNSREKGIKSWQNFAPLDYYELEKQYGRITNITSQDDRLLIHTVRGLFITREKARLDTDVLSVVLGSGDIFDFNPVKVIDFKEGIGGLTHDVSVCHSPLGYMFFDFIHKTPYLFNGSLKSISNACYTFFLEFVKKISNNPLNSEGVIFGYDTVYRRIFLTYKDGDNSFTISYCMDSENWISFHDYIPDVYINGLNKTFSIKNKEIFSHNTGIIGRYYDNNVKPFIIDIPFNTDKEVILKSVKWINECVFNQFKGETVNEKETFDTISVRTGLEHSGEVELFRKSWIDKNYSKVGVLYSFDRIRNQVERNNKPFIKSINNNLDYSPIDTIAEWYRKGQLRNNWFIVRLKDNNNSGVNISLNECLIDI